MFGFVSIVTMFAASNALASNLTFLNDTPLAAFTDEDYAIMRQNAETVLSDAKTPAKREWKNPKTKSSGTAETLAAFAGPKGEPCKRIQIVNHAAGRDSKASYTLCTMDAEGWRLVPSDYATPKGKPAAAPPP
jgi:hypothetical protein